MMQKTTISFKSWRVLFSAILVLVLFITGRGGRSGGPGGEP